MFSLESPCEYLSSDCGVESRYLLYAGALTEGRSTLGLPCGVITVELLPNSGRRENTSPPQSYCRIKRAKLNTSEQNKKTE